MVVFGTIVFLKVSYHTFLLFFPQTNMMASTKDIARTAQDIVLQSANEPDQLGNLASHISTAYQQLANDAKRASVSTSAEMVEMGQKIRVTVQELGKATIELVKATGSCQVKIFFSWFLDCSLCLQQSPVIPLGRSLLRTLLFCGTCPTMPVQSARSALTCCRPCQPQTPGLTS